MSYLALCHHWIIASMICNYLRLSIHWRTWHEGRLSTCEIISPRSRMIQDKPVRIDDVGVASQRSRWSIGYKAWTVVLLDCTSTTGMEAKENRRPSDTSEYLWRALLCVQHRQIYKVYCSCLQFKLLTLQIHGPEGQRSNAQVDVLMISGSDFWGLTCLAYSRMVLDLDSDSSSSSCCSLPSSILPL